MLEAFKRWIARGKDSAAERAARISGDVTSASVGGLTGLVLAGPPGIVAGAAVASVLKEAIKSALDRAATQRAVTVFTLASKRICAERESGKQLRADGFFDDSVSGRSAAEEVLEQIVQAAQQEPEERKLPLMANLYASIAFREDVDRGMASLFVRTPSSCPTGSFACSPYSWTAAPTISGPATTSMQGIVSRNRRSTWRRVSEASSKKRTTCSPEACSME